RFSRDWSSDVCSSDLPATAHTPSSTTDPIALRGEVAVVLPMRHAGVQAVVLRYEIHGPAGAPVVLVAGGISAHRHVAASSEFPEKGWANALVAAGRTLDPAR